MLISSPIALASVVDIVSTVPHDGYFSFQLAECAEIAPHKSIASFISLDTQVPISVIFSASYNLNKFIKNPLTFCVNVITTPSVSRPAPSCTVSQPYSGLPVPADNLIIHYRSCLFRIRILKTLSLPLAHEQDQ